MTNEAKSSTEKWVESKSARYPYAYDPKGAVFRWAGVRGIPHAVLIDPSGKVVWTGHPGQLDEATVEEALDGALGFPVYSWPASAKRVRKALVDGNYARALEEARALSGEGGPKIVAFLERRIAARTTELREVLERGDYLGAKELAEETLSGMKGLAPAEVAQEVLERVKAPEAREVLLGQKRLRRLEEAGREAKKKKEIDKLVDKARDLRKKYPGTYVEKQADELISKLLAKARRH